MTKQTQKQTLKVIGLKIREIRIEKGMSQEALSKKCGFSRPNLSLLENGKGNPSIGTLINICKAMGYWLHVELT